MDYCGTPRGMDEHRKKNTPPCKWCKKAIEKPAPAPKPEPAPKPRKSGAKPAGERRQSTPPTRQIPECGTSSGYARHQRLDHPDCPPCREAANKERQGRRRAAAEAAGRKPGRPRRLTIEQVNDIVARRRKGEPVKPISADHGVSPTYIADIMAGRRLADLTGFPPTATRRKAA